MRDGGARRMVPGARLRDVCEWVEAETARLGGAPAFPAQTSCNEVAAHDCPAPDDGRVYRDGDMAKLDVGVHVDGWVVDTATTVDIGRAQPSPPVQAARAALAAAIAVAGRGVPVLRLSAAIESTIHGFGLRTMRNLCGHGVGRWTVHCAPAIPNVPFDRDTILSEDLVVAIEPFATAGSGMVGERGQAQVFRIDPRRIPPRLSPPLRDLLHGFNGLPFARRQLRALPHHEVEGMLAMLLADGSLHGYPPLVEMDGEPVAQAEHTIYIGGDGVEVLTA